MPKSITRNTLFYGDNLDILQQYIPDESVDLIYLDPPFNSSRSYNVLFKDEGGKDSDAQITAFEDTWHWGQDAEQTYHQILLASSPNVSRMISALRDFIGANQMMAYLVMMTARLIELHRVLKTTGSIYLHCDPTASHYLKIVLDIIFGPKQFRNEIIWRRTGAHGARRTYGPIHDTVLFYTKSDDYYFNIVSQPYTKGHVDGRYTKDAAGRLKFTSGGNVLTGPGATGGESGAVWRGFDPSAKNRHWAIPGFLSEKMPPEFNKLGTLDKLDALYKAGLIDINPGTAWPTPVRYLDDTDGQPLQDIWAYQPYTEGVVYGSKEGIDDDVKWLGPTDPERLGYQTQKPLGLLERIIESSAPQDGWILDPFCGCGTSIAAAQKLNRRWIGIDVTHLSITLMKYRLKAAFELVDKKDYSVIGEPESIGGARQLAGDDRYQFQWWALSLVQAKPLGAEGSSKEGKKGSDKGIDGIINFINEKNKLERVLIQVKSGHVKSGDIRDLRGTVEREGAAMGVFITLEEPSKEMTTEAVSSGYFHSNLWQQDYPRIQILTIQELLNDKSINMPRSAPGQTFKQADKIKKQEGTQGTLDL